MRDEKVIQALFFLPLFVCFIIFLYWDFCFEYFVFFFAISALDIHAQLCRGDYIYLMQFKWNIAKRY